MTTRYLELSQVILFICNIVILSSTSSVIEYSSKTRRDDIPDCFHFIYKRLTWRKASEYCAMELSSDLLVIPSDKVFVDNLIQKTPGLSKHNDPQNKLISKSKLCHLNTTLATDTVRYRQTEQDFSWDSNEPLGFIPDPFGNGLCYIVQQQQQPYKDYLSMYTEADFPFVCKFSRKIAAVNEFAANVTKNSCRREKELEYKIYPAPTDWLSAEKICQNNSGHLVELHDQNTNTILMDLLRSFPNISSIWIGLTFTQGGWRWSDNRSSAYWEFPRGSGRTSREGPRCTEVITRGFYEDPEYVKEGSWNITSCDIPHPFVCQRSKSAIIDEITNQSNIWTELSIGIFVFIAVFLVSCVCIANRKGLIVIPFLTTTFWNGKWNTIIQYKKLENETDVKDQQKCENAVFSIE